MSYVLFVLGVLLYSIFEGITEAIVWEEFSDSRYELSFTAMYHFYRLLETFGIVLIGIGVYMIYPSVLQGILLGLGSILFAILPYRVAFVLMRNQKELFPVEWDYWIWLPVFGDIVIPYPKSRWIILTTAFGLLLMISGILL